MPKRKRQSENVNGDVDVLQNTPPVPQRRASSRKAVQPEPAQIDPNPDTNPAIEDGKSALRASPDAEGRSKQAKAKRSKKSAESTGAAVKAETAPETPLKAVPASREYVDPEADDEEDADPQEVQEALSRPPPVNSSYLPLPWKGRLGYACLCTYLRAATPPVFSSRTCRIASILEHRHPLKDPSQPEHATKNRPDKDQPADVARGQAYVEALGIANARDIAKMLRWNDRYGIKFFRLSSEMFPFASHDIYGYKLAPFASEALAEAGKVAAELGHRLTTHPGQFTQLGSPRKEVITASIRDLEYHCELLDLLKLPPQQDRDAVMILHMGGIFGDKAATIERFRENYKLLSDSIKKRLVLENDDVCYTVHDLLPICEELNIPMVLDYHHHNILFDADKIREGTLDIMNLYDRIKATWTRKGITQKMHYSEQTPPAITGRQRRKHNPRVATLPPCAPDMDLMIEAKDKEQAVFELMRTFKLPGYDTFNDILPYVRNDENKPWKPPKKKTPKKKKADPEEDEEEEPEPQPPPIIPDEEVSMGGPQGRVYWPPGMEEWLRPKKREVKPRDPEKQKSTAQKAAERRAEKAAWQAAREASAELTVDLARHQAAKSVYNKANKKSKPARAGPKKVKKVKPAPTPDTTSLDGEDMVTDDDDVDMPDLTDGEEDVQVPAKLIKAKSAPALARRQSGRAKKASLNYADSED
ncbi:UV-damage endonuclease [Cyphellophora attinorum]|uniref:UV-damage endonuclease n=1 Tax=Cyphellophora attinorum TaxID=1664694 RepID=A0A0N1H7S0_9EURO|nr:UV-damage endonuclease [Phialophora attinorum]KPI39166.1 UV-damage endonuclease [Phialophora attinorum]